MLWGGELILRDGCGRRPGDLRGVGRDDRLRASGWPTCEPPTTSVINADWINAGSYEVNVGGQLHPVSVSLKPLYDPTNAANPPVTDYLPHEHLFI